MVERQAFAFAEQNTVEQVQMPGGPQQVDLRVDSDEPDSNQIELQPVQAADNTAVAVDNIVVEEQHIVEAVAEHTVGIAGEE